MFKTITISTRAMVTIFGFVIFVLGVIYLWSTWSSKGWTAFPAMTILFFWFVGASICLFYIHKQDDENVQYLLGAILVLLGIGFIPAWEYFDVFPKKVDVDLKIRLLYIENFIMTASAVIGGSVMADSIYSGSISKTSKGASNFKILCINIFCLASISFFSWLIGSKGQSVMTSSSYWTVGTLILSLPVIRFSRKYLTMDSAFIAGLFWIGAGLLPPFILQMNFDSSEACEPDTFFTLWRNFNLYFWGGLGAGVIVNSLRIKSGRSS